MGYDPLRDTAAEQQAGVDEFDRAYFRMFGRYPEESPLAHMPPPDPRRKAILNLIERGATEGEREAAREALARIDRDAQDEEDYLDARLHGAA